MRRELTDPRKWAEDVYYVYDYLGVELPDDATPAQRALHSFAQSGSQNEREFLKNMLPKATDILSKLQKPDDDAEIIRSERRSIADLKLKLEEAIRECQQSDG